MVSLFSKQGIYLLILFTLVSFIANIVAVYQSPKFAFYFPLCRFWEMAVGGIVAYLNLKIQNKLVINLMSILSLIAIFTAVWIINEDSLFPGWWAIVPTLSAAALIMAGN